MHVTPDSRYHAVQLQSNHAEATHARSIVTSLDLATDSSYTLPLYYSTEAAAIDTQQKVACRVHVCVLICMFIICTWHFQLEYLAKLLIAIIKIQVQSGHIPFELQRVSKYWKRLGAWYCAEWLHDCLRQYAIFNACAVAVHFERTATVKDGKVVVIRACRCSRKASILYPMMLCVSLGFLSRSISCFTQK